MADKQTTPQKRGWRLWVSLRCARRSLCAQGLQRTAAHWLTDGYLLQGGGGAEPANKPTKAKLGTANSMYYDEEVRVARQECSWTAHHPRQKPG
jgi:hypothetical protein